MGKTKDITGVDVVKINGALYARIDVQKRFGGAITIESLAKAMVIQESEVLYGLLDCSVNLEVVNKLYADHVPRGAWDGTCGEGYWHARTELAARSTSITCPDNCRVPIAQVPVFHTWTLPPTRVLLKLSTGVKAFLARAERKGEEDRQRATLRAVRPNFEKLRAQVAQLKIRVEALTESDTQYTEFVVAPSASDLYFLNQADALLGNMIQFPKGGLHDPVRLYEVEKLRKDLQRFLELANKHLLYDPPPAHGGNLLRERRHYARQVLDALRSRPAQRDGAYHADFTDFEANIKKLVQHPDLDPKLLDEVCEALALAYRALAKTDLAEECLKDISAGVDMLASKSFELPGALDDTANPAFDTAARQATAVPPDDSPLIRVLKLVVAAGPNAIGNAPGPKSLGVVVLEIAGTAFLRDVANNPMAAGKLSGKLYRGLVNAVGLGGPRGQPGRVMLMESVQGNSKNYRKVQALLTTRTMTSPKWVSAGAVMNLISFAFAVQRDPQSTAERWAHVADMIGTTSGAASAALRGFKSLCQSWWKGILVARAGFAVVGGLAGVVAGAATAYEAFDKNDNPTGWLAVGAAVGGLTSLACWMMGVGVGTSEFGVGLVLLAGGLVLSIGTAIYSSVRSWVEEGSHAVYGACLLAFDNRHDENFGKEMPTHSALVMKERPELQDAYDALTGDHNRWSEFFWPVDPERRVHLLQDVGFDSVAVDQITDEAPPAANQDATGAGGASGYGSGGAHGAGGTAEP